MNAPVDALSVNGDHPVIAVLAARRAQESTPGRRDDGCRVGLAVEGGGMRGVLSGAMLAALGDCGLMNAFDAIYAYSSGAINSAYFISGGGWQSLSVYYDDLISKRFLSYRRTLGTDPVVSLDYVFDVVMEERKPLDYDRLLANPIQLNLIASSIDNAHPHVFKGLDTKEDVKSALRASASIPFIAGPPVTRYGERFVDGAVLLPHPFLTAEADGCTHVLVIRTRSDNSAAGRLTVGKRLLADRLERMRPGMRDAMFSAVRSYGPVAARVSQHSSLGTGDPYVLDVASEAGTRLVSAFTQDRARVYQGMREAYGAMLRALTGYTGEILLRPTRFHD